MDDGLWFAVLMLSFMVIVLSVMFVGHWLESRKQIKRGLASETTTLASTEIRSSAPVSVPTASATAPPAPAPAPVVRPLATPPPTSKKSTPAAPPELSRRARRRQRQQPAQTVPLPDSVSNRPARILAKVFYREARRLGYSPNQIIAIAAELINEVVNDLHPRK